MMQRDGRRALLGAVVGVWLVGCGARQRPDGGKGLLGVGANVPALSSVDQDGAPVALAAERGHPVVVYFYPKDGTPGCTREACAFRDVWTRYLTAGVKVVGVSADSQSSHKKFATEHRLPFSLVADEDGLWARSFGVSSTFGMDSRVTFLIGPDGTITHVYPDVDPGVHAERVLGDATGTGAVQ